MNTAQKMRLIMIRIGMITGVLILVSCAGQLHIKEARKISESGQTSTYVIVEPGIHPSLLFAKEEIEMLRKKKNENVFVKNMWDKIVQYSEDWTLDGEWINRGMEMNALALLYQINGDKGKGQQALSMLKSILAGIDPHEYYFDPEKNDIFWTDDWPKAFAYAYDWLYPLMTVTERKELSGQLAHWCKELYEHTEKQWWQGASYNVGAIPVGALGLLCVAIQSELKGDPEFEKWLNSALVRIRDNYFPTTWRQNGICYEGPDYAQYLRNPVLFAEALRRNGGPDILTKSGAINAMNYQRHQWMPGGEESPIGDNTTYGRRVFQSIYLLGIDEMRDQAGLHTFLKWTEPDNINPILAFLLYPNDLTPESAGNQELATSQYFEITPNRAGYFFGRSEWDNEEAAFFAFVTRNQDANHQHYDMNSFLFSAFGEEFATHANLFPYQDSLHGVDFEHNLVIVDGGGMPSHDAINGAGDDNSVNGYMTGVGAGHFGDYVRGDAALSYQDRSLPGSNPGIRADRYGAFIKQGPNPYIIMVDDIQKSLRGNHIYNWLWYTKALEVTSGQGNLSDPLIISGENARCAIGFITPQNPEYQFKITKKQSRHHPEKLGLISIPQAGKRVQYFAVAAAWKNGKQMPTFIPGPEIPENRDAKSVIVKGVGYSDYILWQPASKNLGSKMTLSGEYIETDAFLSVIRINEEGKVTGYLMGDGTYLYFKNKRLVQSDQIWTVSADSTRLMTTGAQRAKVNLPPRAARGRAWLPGERTAVFVNGKKLEPAIQNGMAVIDGDKKDF